MTLFRRSIPVVLFLLSVVFGYVLLRGLFQVVYLYAIGVTVLLIVFSVVVWTRRIPKLDGVSFFLPFFVFVVSSWGFFLFLEQQLFQYLHIAVIAIILYLYSENTFRFIYSAEKYQVSALTNLIRYMSILSIFFAAVSFFDVRFFFGSPLFSILPIFFVLLFLILYPVFWSLKISTRAAVGYGLVTSFVITELTFAITQLPFIPLVKGVVTLAISYAMMQILVLALTDQIERKKVLRTLSFSVLLLIITLATAQWI